MKPPILICLLLLISSGVYAQQNRDKLFYFEKMEKYRRMKNTGSVLTVTGGAVFIIGIATAANSSTTTTYNGYTTQTYTTGHPEQAAFEVLFGMAALGAGIPLWTVGAHSQHKYERALESLSLQPYSAPQQRGITLCYRF